MSDLISRRDVVECVYKALRTPPLKGVFTDTMSLAVRMVNDLPSAQSNIIRCKGCEYLCNEDGLRGMCWHINGFGTNVEDKDNNFCSWGERKTDEHSN